MDSRGPYCQFFIPSLGCCLFATTVRCASVSPSKYNSVLDLRSHPCHLCEAPDAPFHFETPMISVQSTMCKMDDDYLMMTETTCSSAVCMSFDLCNNHLSCGTPSSYIPSNSLCRYSSLCRTGCIL